MSVSGTLVVVITASFLKPLLGSNQSAQFPAIAVYDRNNDVHPFEESDGGTNLLLRVNLPHLLHTKSADLDIKRQFDPWGGKRLSGDQDADGKRQFRPWGGKRFFSRNTEEDKGNDETQMKGLVVPWSAFNSWNAKRSFNSWGGKRNYNSNTLKKTMGGRDTPRLSLAKRNFNAWGGKRSATDESEDYDVNSIPNKNTNVGGKRQAFNSWGGKRSFNSWGGKRATDAVSAKDEINNPQDNLVSSTYYAMLQGKDRTMS